MKRWAIERALATEAEAEQELRHVPGWLWDGETLPVANGAPVRLRIERALGYKQPKYLHTIELVDSFAAIGRGRGGYWEDRGYDWFGGI